MMVVVALEVSAGWCRRDQRHAHRRSSTEEIAYFILSYRVERAGNQDDTYPTQKLECADRTNE